MPTSLKRPPVQRYGLAVVSFAVALGGALWLNRYNVRDVEFPLFLLAIAVSAWYAGTAPGRVRLVLSSLAFNYFYTEPRYSFEIARVDVPYLVIFVLFASLVTWFSTVRRRVEQQLLQSNDRLGKEVAERPRQMHLATINSLHGVGAARVVVQRSGCGQGQVVVLVAPEPVEGAGDVQGEHPLDPHPLHIDHRLCVLLEVSLPQAVIMDVPDPQLAQLLAGGEAIVGRVESKLIGAGSVHRLFSAFQESFGIAAHHPLQLRSAQRRLEQLEHSALAGEIGRMGTEDYALHGQRRPAGIAVSGD